MFQKFIYKVIQMIKCLYEQLDMAYEQTYTDKKLGHKFQKEKERKIRENKYRIINKVKESIQEDYKRQTGNEMPDIAAMAFATDFYTIAKAKGDIDELGNFIGDIDFD